MRENSVNLWKESRIATFLKIQLYMKSLFYLTKIMPLPTTIPTCVGGPLSSYDLYDKQANSK